MQEDIRAILDRLHEDSLHDPTVRQVYELIRCGAEPVQVLNEAVLALAQQNRSLQKRLIDCLNQSPYPTERSEIISYEIWFAPYADGDWGWQIRTSDQMPPGGIWKKWSNYSTEDAAKNALEALRRASNPYEV